MRRRSERRTASPERDDVFSVVTWDMSGGTVPTINTSGREQHPDLFLIWCGRWRALSPSPFLKLLQSRSELDGTDNPLNVLIHVRLLHILLKRLRTARHPCLRRTPSLHHHHHHPPPPNPPSHRRFPKCSCPFSASLTLTRANITRVCQRWVSCPLNRRSPRAPGPFTAPSSSPPPHSTPNSPSRVEEVAVEEGRRSI